MGAAIYRKTMAKLNRGPATQQMTAESEISPTLSLTMNILPSTSGANTASAC